jgi:glycine reductase
VVDGAIVSGVFAYGMLKNPTYLHQNNPIIWELQARHGHDLDFAGVILTRGHNYTQMEKERSSHWATKLAGFLGADGVILTTEGGGNSEIDTMLALQYMERAGIRTTAIHYEQGGPDGRAFPLTFTVPEADAYVSVGSINGTVRLPAVARAIGDDVLLLEGDPPAAAALDAGARNFYCSTNQLGGNVLRGTQF